MYAQCNCTWLHGCNIALTRCVLQLMWCPCIYPLICPTVCPNYGLHALGFNRIHSPTLFQIHNNRRRRARRAATFRPRDGIYCHGGRRRRREGTISCPTGYRRGETGGTDRKRLASSLPGEAREEKLGVTLVSTFGVRMLNAQGEVQDAPAVGCHGVGRVNRDDFSSRAS